MRNVEESVRGRVRGLLSRLVRGYAYLAIVMFLSGVTGGALLAISGYDINGLVKPF